MKSFFKMLTALLVLVAVGYILISYWSVIFSKTIKGRVEAVEKLQIPVAVIGGAQPGQTSALGNRELFSFAVAIRQEDGDTITASSEDRQWSVVSKGMCVEAKLFPYPPWDFEKGGTYFNARLLDPYDCPPSLSEAK